MLERASWSTGPPLPGVRCVNGSYAGALSRPGALTLLDRALLQGCERLARVAGVQGQAIIRYGTSACPIVDSAGRLAAKESAVNCEARVKLGAQGLNDGSRPRKVEILWSKTMTSLCRSFQKHLQ